MRVLALCAVIALAGCSLHWPGPAATPSPVRLAFERAFIKGCKVGGPAGTLYCECVKTEIEQSMTDAELSKVSPFDPRVKRATHDCAHKTGLQVRPGM